MSDELVSVQGIKIEPNNCPLEEELGLEIDFTLTRPLPSSSWQIRFIADTASARKIIELGATASEDYPAGANSMRFKVGEVSVAHLKRHVLANVGLLLAVLFSEDKEVLQVSMVTQVTPNSEGTLIRSIFNPLE